ncbi:MAG: VIT domain-containing protein [Marinoscillum sp.]
MRRLILLITLFLSFNLFGQKPGHYRPAPYIQCYVAESGLRNLPLHDFTVDAEISGPIADITLEQTFVNTFNVPLEVIYVFPASSRAAIYGLTMTIGDRMINAEIQQKYQARETYKKAVEDGYRTSLLEQTRPNVFQMRVGNIMPKDTIVVSLFYTEFIESNNGYYQFIVPTTIGQRYAGENRRGEAEPVITTYTSTSQSPYPLNININLNSPVPISHVKSSSHKIDFDVMDTQNWAIILNPTERFSANRDFIFEYRLRGEQLESGALVNEGESENFFMLQIQPPQQVTYEDVPPREYLFVLDVSGSMQGFPMATAKDLLEELLEDLKPNDIFNIVPFEFASTKLFRTSQLATDDNIRKARRFMRMRMSSGGTNMTNAFRDVYRSISDEPISRSIILITDGQIEAEKRVLQEIRNNLYKANVFAFGIGLNVNRYLIESVASAGMGEAFIVTNSAYAREQATALARYIKRPALTNIRVDFTNNFVYDVSPPSLPDVLSERPITIYGKYEGELSEEIIITGVSGKSNYQKTITLAPDASRQNAALTYLWARNRLKDIEEFGPEGLDRQNAITQLGLQYNLLTDYTSFVAVDSEVANISNQLVSVAQPLARPANPIPATEYQQRLYTTGAVSRAASTGNLRLHLPAQSEVSAPLVLVSWKASESGPYVLTLDNIYNQNLLTKEITDNYFWLNLQDYEYDMGLYLLKITNQNGETSSEVGLKKVMGLGEDFRDLFNLNYAFGEQEYLSAISDLLNNKLLVDAFTLVEIAVMNYPESEPLNQKRNEIWGMIGEF